MESGQALKVGVKFLGLNMGWQFFYAKMHKDRHITIPKLILSLFEDKKTSSWLCLRDNA